MIEAGHIYPWDEVSDERVACTLDIKSELKGVHPYSFEEYSLCFEAALDKDRKLSKRERFLLTRFGKEYVDSPDSFNEKLDELEQKTARHVGDFILVQNSPTLVVIGRLASPKIDFDSYISAHGWPLGVIEIEISSSIFTVLDEKCELVPELSGDFVGRGRHHLKIFEGTTQLNWLRDLGGSVMVDEHNLMKVDPEKSCYHEGDESTIRFGFEEIAKWQGEHFQWAEHVDNMIEAYTTGFINYPVARRQPLESALDWIK